MLNIEENVTSVNAATIEGFNPNRIKNRRLDVTVILLDYSGSCVKGEQPGVPVNQRSDCSPSLGLGMKNTADIIWDDNSRQSFNNLNIRCTQELSPNKYFEHTTDCSIHISVENFDVDAPYGQATLFYLFAQQANASARGIFANQQFKSWKCH